MLKNGSPTMVPRLMTNKTVYINDLKELFHLPTQEDYSGHLQALAKKWSAPFFDYYNRNIHPDIATIARWSIQRLGVYHPFNGVANNQAEGINFVLKQLQDWKEAPVDCMILALHYLQGYYSYVRNFTWSAEFGQLSPASKICYQLSHPYAITSAQDLLSPRIL